MTKKHLYLQEHVLAARTIDWSHIKKISAICHLLSMTTMGLLAKAPFNQIPHPRSWPSEFVAGWQKSSIPIIGNDVAVFHLSIQDDTSTDSTCHVLAHPLLNILESVYQTGSIVKAAKHLGRSYRSVWGELKCWESELNASLIIWGRNGKGAALTPQAIEFLGAVSRTQIDLAPQLSQIKKRFQQCVVVLKNTNTAK